MSEKTSNFVPLPNAVVVFPTTLNGKHKEKYLKLGAVKGCGIGIRGNTYALPIRDYEGKGLTRQRVESYIKTLRIVAEQHEDKIFLLEPLQQWGHSLYSNLLPNMRIVDTVYARKPIDQQDGNTGNSTQPHIIHLLSEPVGTPPEIWRIRT